MITSRRVILLVAVALVAGLPAAAREKKPRPDFTGTWAIAGDSSDSSTNAEGRAKSRPRRPIFGPPRGGFGGPMSGPGMGGPIVRNKPDEETMARSKEIARVGAEAPRRLAIASDGATLTFTNEVGRIVKIRTDGQKTFEVSDGGLELERKAHWDDDKLVCDIKAKGGGGEIKQVITIENGRLVVMSTVDPDIGERAVKVRHVYDRELTPVESPQ
jgi:hypothetical protein